VAGSSTTHLFTPLQSTSPQELITSLSSPHATNLFFRGQSNFDWLLRPVLERKLESLDMDLSGFRFIENSLMGEFKRHAKAVLHVWPTNDDVLGWLALMQHYRAPTRLLDWTESPFVALFFAIRDLDKSVDAALWILDPKKCLALHPWVTYGEFWDHLGTREIDSASIPPNSEHLPSVHSYDEEQNYRFRCALALRSRWPLPIMPDWQDARMAAQ
jgi:hypothetical protein